MQVTGTWKGNDGAYYFLREVTPKLVKVGTKPDSGIFWKPQSEIWWVGIHPELKWVNVFSGERANNVIRGNWANVPKGQKAHKGGELTLNIGPLYQTFGEPPDTEVLLKTSKHDKFGCSKWEPIDRKAIPPLPTDFEPFYAEETQTGGWQCDDGGSYYMVQSRPPHGSTKILWYAENPKAGWAHVFRGKYDYDRFGRVEAIEGDWCDVPVYGSANNGILRLAVWDETQDQVMDRQSETGGFGGSRWIRRDAQTALEVIVRKLECVEVTSGLGEDEPYFVSFSVSLNYDGGKIVETKDALAANSRVFDDDESMGSGAVRNVGLHIWGSRLTRDDKPVLVPAPIPFREKAIILLGLIENDGRSPGKVRKSVNFVVSHALVAATSNDSDYTTICQTIHKTMEDAIDSACDVGIADDERIDVDQIFLSHEILQRARHEPVEITKVLKGDGGHYKQL